MSRRPTEPRPGTLTASVLASIRRGPGELGQAAAELGCTAAQVHHTLMRLRAELHQNIVTLGEGRYERGAEETERAGSRRTDVRRDAEANGGSHLTTG